MISKDTFELNTAIKQINDRRDLMFVIAADAKATHQDVIRNGIGQLGFVNVKLVPKCL